MRLTIIPLLLTLLLAFLLTVAGLAGAEEAEPEPTDDVRYVSMQPAFVCNFGMADNGHLMYLKTDISIRVGSRNAELAARNHMPALRNSLVLLLSRQDEATVATGFGREAIRAEALEELNGILQAEEGQAFIDDLMFTNFIVQR
ncbi:MAG: flagellar basal body-associated FliL family protein [Gammaproteobacteria bacterium]|nr:flagellar basal body-associated FliL family protein [Gammaproteobacteria bacterium]